MRIAKCESEQSLQVPITFFLKLSFSFLKLLTHFSLNSRLQLVINHRYEKLVEMYSAHRTCHAHFCHLLGALHAYSMLARNFDWLDTKLKANWALVLL